MKGKFICIEGADGTGKETQTTLLVEHLRKEGYVVKTGDFPQYDSFFGKMIGKLLTGEYGDINKIHPDLATLPFALDRAMANEEIARELKEGNIYVANRFTFSNIAHQCGRIDPDKRAEFIKFNLQLENDILKILTPDLYVVLNVPSEISRQMIFSKRQRDYIKDGNVDQNESDLSYQMQVSNVFREVSDSMQNVVKVNCCNSEGELMTREEVHNKVWQKVSGFLVSSGVEGQSLSKERNQ
jgi:dTMP kinase